MAANEHLRREMQDFVASQRQERRSDKLLDSVRVSHNVLYPLAPNAQNPNGGEFLKDTVPPPPEDGPSVVPYVCEKRPKFLSRAREYMCRRTEEGHVRKAMEDKVERTRRQLETLAQDRLAERQVAEDGLIINDALRYDNELLKNMERKENAEYVKAQIEERKERATKELRDRRSQPGGYWGPEEKPPRSGRMKHQTREELESQMQVNESRKVDSRQRKLVQERCIVENAVKELVEEQGR